MSATQDQIDTLLAAIGSSTLRVRFADGREVYYRSVGEMRDALALLRGQLSTFDNCDRGTFAAIDRR